MGKLINKLTTVWLKIVSMISEAQWREDIKSKSSLKYINSDNVKVGVSLHVWSTAGNNIHGIRRAKLKCRLLTGIYTLQSNREVLNKFAVKLISRVCEKNPVTRQTR